MLTYVKQDTDSGSTDKLQEEEMQNTIKELDKGLGDERLKVISTYLYDRLLLIAHTIFLSILKVSKLFIVLVTN